VSAGRCKDYGVPGYCLDWSGFTHTAWNGTYCNMAVNMVVFSNKRCFVGNYFCRTVWLSSVCFSLKRLLPDSHFRETSKRTEYFEWYRCLQAMFVLTCGATGWCRRCCWRCGTVPSGHVHYLSVEVRSCRSSSGSRSLGRLSKPAAEFKNWSNEKGWHHFLFVSNCLCKLAQNGRSSVKGRIPNRLALWLGAIVAGCCEGLV
jgi:hypothetical protein